MRKGLAIFLSTLSVGLAVAVGVGSSGFTNWHVKEWFDSWGKGSEQSVPPDENPVEIGTLGGGMVMTNEASGAPVRLASYAIAREAFEENGIAAQSDSAYTVTATVAPDNDATNTTIEWSISWKTTSGWVYENGVSKNINDYVTIAPGGEDYIGSKTVTVTCLQSFGEPIILTATCKYAAGTRASIQIDYAARFNLMMGYFSATGNPNQDMEKENPNISFTTNTEVTFEFGQVSAYHSIFPSSIMYTIEGDYTITDTYQFTLTLARDTSKELFNNPIIIKGNNFNTVWHTQDLGSYTVAKSESGSPYCSIAIPFTGGQGAKFNMTVSGIGSVMTHGGSHGYSSSLKNDIDSGEYTAKEASDSFRSFLDMTPNRKVPLCTMELTVAGTKATYVYETDVYIRKVIFSTPITGVTLDQGAIVI